jgi:hypothetical protein
VSGHAIHYFRIGLNRKGAKFAKGTMAAEVEQDLISQRTKEA